eukprot:4842210-Prymnesium_polylepis.1
MDSSAHLTQVLPPTVVGAALLGRSRRQVGRRVASGAAGGAPPPPRAPLASLVAPDPRTP